MEFELWHTVHYGSVSHSRWEFAACRSKVVCSDSKVINHIAQDDEMEANRFILGVANFI